MYAFVSNPAELWELFKALLPLFGFYFLTTLAFEKAVSINGGKTYFIWAAGFFGIALVYMVYFAGPPIETETANKTPKYMIGNYCLIKSFEQHSKYSSVRYKSFKLESNSFGSKSWYDYDEEYHKVTFKKFLINYAMNNNLGWFDNFTQQYLGFDIEKASSFEFGDFILTEEKGYFVKAYSLRELDYIQDPDSPVMHKNLGIYLKQDEQIRCLL